MDRSLAWKKSAQRFWSSVDKHGANECWLWKEKHLIFSLAGRTTSCGRAAWLLQGNKIHKRQRVFHRCNNERCFNPAHLAVSAIGASRDHERMAEDFWSRVVRGDKNECWSWKGAKNDFGYGHLRFTWRGMIVTRAHRVAWLLTHGFLPKKLDVLHSCDNPACCNPVHLRLGTAADNMRDCVARGRIARGSRHGLRLHPECVSRGERHHTAVLTAQQVLEIRHRCGQGEKQLRLAAEFGVSQGTVSALVRRITWKHV